MLKMFSSFFKSITSAMKKRFSPSEQKLRAMYRLGVIAGEERERQTSGAFVRLRNRDRVASITTSNLPEKPPALLVLPASLPPPALPTKEQPVKAGALARAYHRTHPPKRVALKPAPPNDPDEFYREIVGAARTLPTIPRLIKRKPTSSH